MYYIGNGQHENGISAIQTTLLRPYIYLYTCPCFYRPFCYKMSLLF